MTRHSADVAIFTPFLTTKHVSFQFMILILRQNVERDSDLKRDQR
jgi:hypothetical protein